MINEEGIINQELNPLLEKLDQWVRKYGCPNCSHEWNWGIGFFFNENKPFISCTYCDKNYERIKIPDLPLVKELGEAARKYIDTNIKSILTPLL